MPVEARSHAPADGQDGCLAPGCNVVAVTPDAQMTREKGEMPAWKP